jgi:hypothetical protein
MNETECGEGSDSETEVITVSGGTGQDEVLVGPRLVCFMDSYQCMDWSRDQRIGVYCGGGGPAPFGEAH